MYNLEYKVGNKVIETIMYNKPLPLVKWKKKQLEQSNNYKIGKLCMKLIT